MTHNTERSSSPKPVESLETRQMLAADLPDPFRPPIIFDANDRIMMFGMALSMARSFPSNLMTRVTVTSGERAESSVSTVKTSSGRETDSPENAVPTGDAPATPTSAPEAVQTFKLIDLSQKDGDLIDAAKVDARPAEPIALPVDEMPRQAIMLDREVLVASMHPVSTSPFAAIDNAIASALAGHSEKDVVTIATFGVEQQTTRSGMKAEPAAEEEIAAVDERTDAASGLPLAVIAPEITGQASLLRNLLASATIVFAVIGNWYLRRTRKQGRALAGSGRKMIDVPER